MTSTTAVAACDVTKPSQGQQPWRCIRALDHDGDCDFGLESKVYARPVVEQDHAWLASEVVMLLGRIDSMRREQAADQTDARLRRVVTRLVRLAPANATRKTVPLDEVRAVWQEAVNG